MVLFYIKQLALIGKTNSLKPFKHNVKKHYMTVWICVSTSVGVCTCGYILTYFPLTYLSSCCFSFNFSLSFVLTWGTTMKIRRFSPFWTIPAIVDAIHIYLQWYFNFNFNYYNSIFIQFPLVCVYCEIKFTYNVDCNCT